MCDENCYINVTTRILVTSFASLPSALTRNHPQRERVACDCSAIEILLSTDHTDIKNALRWLDWK